MKVFFVLEETFFVWSYLNTEPPVSYGIMVGNENLFGEPAGILQLSGHHVVFPLVFVQRNDSIHLKTMFFEEEKVIEHTGMMALLFHVDFANDTISFDTLPIQIKNNNAIMMNGYFTILNHAKDQDNNIYITGQAFGDSVLIGQDTLPPGPLQYLIKLSATNNYQMEWWKILSYGALAQDPFLSYDGTYMNYICRYSSTYPVVIDNDTLYEIGTYHIKTNQSGTIIEYNYFNAAFSDYKTIDQSNFIFNGKCINEFILNGDTVCHDPLIYGSHSFIIKTDQFFNIINKAILKNIDHVFPYWDGNKCLDFDESKNIYTLISTNTNVNNFYFNDIDIELNTNIPNSKHFVILQLNPDLELLSMNVQTQKSSDGLSLKGIKAFHNNYIASWGRFYESYIINGVEYSFPNTCQNSSLLAAFDLSTIGIPELFDNKQDFSIYPNPANDKIYFSFSETTNNDQNKQIRIYDLFSKLIIEETSNSDYIDISFLKNGLYLLQIVHNEKMYHGKFIKTQ